MKWRRQFESEINLPKSGVSYIYSSSGDSFREDQSFVNRDEHYVDYRQKKIRSFNPSTYQKEKWLYDTPGVILPEQVRIYLVESICRSNVSLSVVSHSLQIVNKASNRTELSYFDHQSTIIKPINIILDAGQTILVGGVARIDIKQVLSSDFYDHLTDRLLFRSATTVERPFH